MTHLTHFQQDCHSAGSNNGKAVAGAGDGRTAPRAAKRYIIGECRHESEASTSVSADAGVQANLPALKRFKYLATKLSVIAPDQESASGLGNCTDTVQGQLNRYIAEFEIVIVV